MIKVLFVCLGNICRSPMAEAYFRHLVTQQGYQNKFEIDSSGIGDWHAGKPPYQGTQKKLDEQGISYEGMYARKITFEDLDAFDYIVVMDNQNLADLKSLRHEAPKARVFKLLDFVTELNEEEVPDPYYTGNFDETYRLVEAGCHALFNLIKSEQDLSK